MRKAILIPLAALLACLAFAGTAAAEEFPPYGAPIEQFSVEPSTSQAGAHPNVTIKFKVGTRYKTYEHPEESGANGIKNVQVNFPAGFIGNPHSVAECSAVQFALDECPPDSQIGLASPSVTLTGCCTPPLTSPLYNLVPQPGQAGLLAFKAFIFAFPIYTVIRPRTESDYGLDTEVKGISGTFQVGEYEQVIWGVPASPIHDAERYKKGGAFAVAGPEISSQPEKPFLSNPTTCSGPLQSEMVSDAYDGVVDTATSPWPATTGCDQLNFNPSQAAKPSTEAADSASGLDTELKVPQNESPSTPSDSEIKAVITKLPAGFSINSSAADGKVYCTDAQAQLDPATPEEAQCPEQSKIGTVTLDSTALPEPITGGIYIGQPEPGNRYRTFLTADGFGVHVKLKGDVHPDPLTGQLTTVFANLPQSPYDEFDLHYFGSERGLLATPTKCGTYAVETEFEPWATGLANQTSTQFFSITSGPGGSPCPGAQRPFSPGFRAVGAGNGGGAHSPFSIYITRNDGEQTLSTIAVKTPPGFSATLKGIPYCSEAAIREIEGGSGLAEQAAPKCPAASQVGVSWSAAGAGAKPFSSEGKVYLTGPYKGAPLSFTVVTPAVSGPYDLGNVVNRVAINVDPVTAQVTATSDPLPQILEGIPLRLRSVLINLNRENFTLNPTDCSPFQVTGALAGSEGGSASPSGSFQVANCDGLGFEPKLTTVLKGGTKRTAHPALTATLTQNPSGQSNISRAVVSLPRSEFLDQSHIGTVCTRVQFAADQCPAASVYGHAQAITPLLGAPLEGPVYLRSSSHKLPDLVAALKGPASQPIEIDLDGRIDSKNGGIRASFETVPDQPVSKFVLSMRGGKKGLLQNSTNICKGKHTTSVKFVGQNGAVTTPDTPLKASCGKATRSKPGKGAKQAGGDR